MSSGSVSRQPIFSPSSFSIKATCNNFIDQLRRQLTIILSFRSKVFLILLASSLSCTNAARILAIFPVVQRSQFHFNHAILRSLHDAGHQVTMVSPFPQTEKKSENFTYVDSHFDSFTSVGHSTIHRKITESMSARFRKYEENEILNSCYNVMRLPQIQEALNSPQKLYDIIFVGLWCAYECYVPMAEKLGVPLVGTSAGLMWKWADASVGNVQNPFTMREFSDMSFYAGLKERLEILWYSIAEDYYYHTIIRERVRQFYLDHFPGALYKKEVSLVFRNSHPSLLSRPDVPNMIDVGGIHVQPANPLPLELQKFIDEAPQGVILFSLGSALKASSMSSELRREFLSAFVSIPQRVIWKFEDSIENLPQNIMISKWLPQRDILEHKNVIAFMSHCGISGMYEAIMTGTPVVTVPLFADQHMNAKILQRRGVGVDLELQTATKEKILAALHTIINDTRYYERMQALTLIFKDRPMTPQESVVYWTEYVIRNNGARHLRALGADIPFYKYFMLDIIALSVIIASAVLLCISLVMRKIMF